MKDFVGLVQLFILTLRSTGNPRDFLAGEQHGKGLRKTTQLL